MPSIFRLENNTPDEPPCVIDRLCELHDGLVVEAKGIKEHYFKPYIKRLFERQVRPLSKTMTTCYLEEYCGGLKRPCPTHTQKLSNVHIP